MNPEIKTAIIFFTFILAAVLGVALIFKTHKSPPNGADCIDQKGWKSIGEVTDVQFVAPAYERYIREEAKTVITAKEMTIILNYTRPVSKGCQANITTDCIGGFWFTCAESNQSYRIYDKSK